MHACGLNSYEVGISLFVPFLQSIDQSGEPSLTGNWLADSVGQLFSSIPPDQRLLVISVSILATILLRASLVYANLVLFGWLDTRIGHRLRSRIFEQLLAVSYIFLEKTESGRLLNILSNESWRMSEALKVLVNIIIAACTLWVYVMLLVLLSWRLTLFVLAVTAGIPFSFGAGWSSSWEASKSGSAVCTRTRFS